MKTLMNNAEKGGSIVLAGTLLVVLWTGTFAAEQARSFEPFVWPSEPPVDLSRFESARSVVKHAGLNPAENTSATLRGATRVSKRGRPGLRAAAWKAVWAALPNNPILAERFRRLTTRAGRRLAPAAARTACAATLLRWLHAIITRRTPFDPRIAAGHTRTPAPLAAAA